MFLPTEVGTPKNDTRPEQTYMGIRTIAPFTGMFKALIEWVRSRGDIGFERWDTEQEDNFRCRYEAYLTDPKIEHRKTKWEVEVATKLKD